MFLPFCCSFVHFLCGFFFLLLFLCALSRELLCCCRTQFLAVFSHVLLLPFFFFAFGASFDSCANVVYMHFVWIQFRCILFLYCLLVSMNLPYTSEMVSIVLYHFIQLKTVQMIAEYSGLFFVWREKRTQMRNAWLGQTHIIKLIDYTRCSCVISDNNNYCHNQIVIHYWLYSIWTRRRRWPPTKMSTNDTLIEQFSYMISCNE